MRPRSPASTRDTRRPRPSRAAAAASTSGAAATSRTVLLWTVAASILALLLALNLRRIWSVDYWWQWKTGEFVARHGIPRTDVFSFSDFGQPRIELRWLYCLGLYSVTALFGPPGAVLVKTLVALAAIALSASLAPWRRAPLLTAAVLVVGIMAGSQRFVVRPEMASYALFIAMVWIVERLRHGPTPWIWAIPALQILWVNSHGLFVIGPALAALWLGTELLEWRRAPADRPRRLRAAGLVLAMSVAASFANPWLHRAVLLSVHQFGALQTGAEKEMVQELASPFAGPQHYTALLHYKLLIGLAVVTVLLDFRRQSLFWVLLVASQLYLSVTAIRNIPLFTLVAVPFVVRNLSGSWAERVAAERLASLRRSFPALRAAAAIGLAAFCLFEARELYTNRFALAQGDTNQSGLGIATHRFALEAVDFVVASGAKGRVFSTPAIGSCLIARGLPAFIDPRGEEHAERVMLEYREISDRPARFAFYEQKYGFRVAMLEPHQLTLFRWLRAQPRWRLVHVDSEALVFFRDDESPRVPALDPARGLADEAGALAEPIDYARRGWLTRLDSPAPYRRLAIVCIQLGQFHAARQYFEWAREAYPPLFTDDEPLGYAAEREHDLVTAADCYQRALARTPDDRSLMLRTASALVRTGGAARARALVDTLLARNPDDVEALAMSGAVALTLGNSAEALDCFLRAAALRPGVASYQQGIARAFLLQGRTASADSLYERAFRLAPDDLAIALDAAASLFQSGDRERAQRWARRAAALAPNDPRVAELQRVIGAPRR